MMVWVRTFCGHFGSTIFPCREVLPYLLVPCDEYLNLQGVPERKKLERAYMEKGRPRVNTRQKHVPEGMSDKK